MSSCADSRYAAMGWRYYTLGVGKDLEAGSSSHQQRSWSKHDGVQRYTRIEFTWSALVAHAVEL